MSIHAHLRTYPIVPSSNSIPSWSGLRLSCGAVLSGGSRRETECASQAAGDGATLRAPTKLATEEALVSRKLTMLRTCETLQLDVVAEEIAKPGTPLIKRVANSGLVPHKKDDLVEGAAPRRESRDGGRRPLVRR